MYARHKDVGLSKLTRNRSRYATRREEEVQIFATWRTLSINTPERSANYYLESCIVYHDGKVVSSEYLRYVYIFCSVMLLLNIFLK